MADALVHPTDIDRAFTFGSPSLLPRPGDTTGILAETALPVLKKHRMLAGYSIRGTDREGEAGRTVGQARALRLSVLRLPDEAAARNAAQEIESADFAVSPDNVAVAIPEYAGAHSHWRPLVPTLGTVVAHGPFVVAIFAGLPTIDLPALTALTTAALKAELPRLDRFVSTPADKLSTLPLDREGMLRRILPAQHGKWPYPTVTRVDIGTVAGYGGAHFESGVVLGPGGADHWTRGDAADTSKPDPAEIESLAAVEHRRLLRMPNAVKARKYFEGKAEAIARDFESIAPPDQVPDTACVRQKSPGSSDIYLCIVRYGRYVATVLDPQEKTVKQMTAAQYALLVNND